MQFGPDLIKETQRGNLEFIQKYCNDNSIKNSITVRQIVYSAAEYGQVEILEYLYKLNVPIDTIYTAVCKMPHQKVIDWINKYDIPLSDFDREHASIIMILEDMANRIVNWTNTEMKLIDWAIKIGCKLTDTTMQTAVLNHNGIYIDLLLERNCEVGWKSTREALKHSPELFTKLFYIYRESHKNTVNNDPIWLDTAIITTPYDKSVIFEFLMENNITLPSRDDIFWQFVSRDLAAVRWFRLYKLL